MQLEAVKEGLGSMWESVSAGWRHLRQFASDALTRFRPGDKSGLPARSEVDDEAYLPTHGWSMLGGDLFEDKDRLLVRVEVPGMEKDEIGIEIVDQALVVSGEKRFEREHSEGRWRIMQCAYGSFRRVVPLPAPVRTEGARASYRNGVLRVELPKAAPGRPKSLAIEVK